MQSVFLTITISCLVLFWLAVQHKLSVAVYITWAFIISSAAIAGFFGKFPASFALTLLGTAITILCCYKLLAHSKINMYLLLAIHLLRIPVEYLLFALFKAKMLPWEMTFIGCNHDLFFGITAFVFLIIGIFYRKIFRFSGYGIYSVFVQFSLLLF